MLGSEFVSYFGPKGFQSWEAAAVQLARDGSIVDWPFQEIDFTDGTNTAKVKVQTDYFAIGTAADHLRLPLTPSKAQEIGNLFGWLLPTPRIVYQTWRAASVRLTPTSVWGLGETSNKGANIHQYALQDAAVSKQLAGRSGLVSGQKKDVVVSSLLTPGKVVIFGWYQPSLPGGLPVDVFDNGMPMGDPRRQPIQPHSNVHGSSYVDYSHGIRFCHPLCLVNGTERKLEDLMQDPVLSKLVSHDGPVKNPRYPAANAPAPLRPVHHAEGYAEIGHAKMVEYARKT